MLVSTHGAGKWSWIASQMAPRTDNQCWRRWKTLSVRDKKDKKATALPVDQELEHAVFDAVGSSSNNSSNPTSSLTSSPAQSPVSIRSVSTSNPQISELMTRQSDLSRRRLSAIVNHFHIDPHVPHSHSHSQSSHVYPSGHSPSSSISIPPIPLDAHNSLALRRLLELLQLDTHDSKTEAQHGSHSPSNSSNFLASHSDPDVESVVSSESFSLLSARFESLFLWPLLLSMSPDLRQGDDE